MAKKSEEKILVLLDGNALIHRAYHALPPLTNKAGQTVGAVYGVAMTLLSVLEKFHPEYIAASFDLAVPTFRHEKFADYKATRVKAPDDLYAQIPLVKDLVRAFNIPIYEQEGFEADDCVGTLARQASELGIPTVIVTGDNDALQLVTPLVKVFALRKGVKDIVLYDKAAVMAKYGFLPAAIPDYKGLAGDNSDNIPGVAGIGVKTATDLLREFGSLEKVYDSLDSVKETVRKKLVADREMAFFSKELGTIDTNAPVAFDPAACVARDFDTVVVAELFRANGFFSLLKRIPGGTESRMMNKESGKRNAEGGTQREGKKKKPKVLKTPEEVKTFLHETEGERVAVNIVSGEASLFGSAGIETVELAHANGAVTAEWNDETKVVIKEFLEDGKIPKVFHDAKAAWHTLRDEDIKLAGIAFDTMVASYLLQAGTRIELEHLLLEEFDPETFASVAEGISRLSSRLRDKMGSVSREQAGQWNLSRLFAEVEIPLIPILANMEREGIRLNTGKFRDLSDTLGKELKTVERKVFDLAGKEFNINSPKQLAEVLFVDLAIPTTGLKRTKTGISTASTELAKLKEYPIVSLVEEERELFKLKTTYLDAFPSLVDAQSRIHTTYQQAVTTTGRLSSTEPNLQNIPAREKWSVAIRGAFEAEPGHLFVGADYSQIELRVMAHVSGDESLMTSFATGEDVHKATASAVFGVMPEEVTSDMRRQAKVFNFGLMYGMSAYGLSQSLGIPTTEAAEFIETYFRKFPGVTSYMESMKTLAREKGYVETELGRRRYVPEISSQNRNLAQSGERMAINMPIQGLEADIVKLAMIRVSEMLPKYGDQARMLLQVHDELIFEVKEAIAEEFATEAKRVMESAYRLRVPLIAETAIGKDWGSLKA
ncbi:MAG: DNA polymerase I [Candidatus Moranbacteria bacterium]|nr:DNA polymerase I [Candidatus Moranbacteria bacterium]